MALNEYSCKLAEGKKAEILSAVDENKFFDVCKEVVLKVNDLLKNV